MTFPGGFDRLRRNVGCLWPVLGVAAGIILLLALLGLGAALRAARVAQQVATPAVIRIPRPSPTPTPQPTVVPTATATAEAAGATGPIGLGDLIEVFGTSGDGVRLRSAPNLDGAIAGLGMDNDVFTVEEGPVEAQGHIWWFLVNPYDTNRQGWAVADYLRPLQSP